MSTQYSLLTRDDDLMSLIPLVKEFAKLVGNSMWQNLNEITSCFISPGAITVYAQQDGELIGYACGYMVSTNIFLITQAYSTNSHNSIGFAFLENEAKKLGATRLMLHTPLEPRVFKRYGFKFERYLLIKDLIAEQSKEEI